MLSPTKSTLSRAIILAGALLFGSAQWAAADDAIPASSTSADGEPLVGVGLVIGLHGTGDSAIDPAIIDNSIVGVLKRAGLEPWRNQIGPGKVAVVMLSAAMPAEASDGTILDVSIQPIGNASSLAGGTLLVAPLRDAAGVVHAVGQGPLAAADGGVAGGAVVRHQHAARTTVASLQ